MTTHRHHVAGRALRLLLARLHSGSNAEIFADLSAEMILIREIGDCSFCWLLVADELADMILAEIEAQIRERRDLTLDGFVRYYERRLIEQLDHDDDEDDAA